MKKENRYNEKITIDRNIWEKLVRIKLKKKFRKFDEVLTDLIQHSKV